MSGDEAGRVRAPSTTAMVVVGLVRILWFDFGLFVAFRISVLDYLPTHTGAYQAIATVGMCGLFQCLWFVPMEAILSDVLEYGPRPRKGNAVARCLTIGLVGAVKAGLWLALLLCADCSGLAFAVQEWLTNP